MKTITQDIKICERQLKQALEMNVQVLNLLIIEKKGHRSMIKLTLKQPRTSYHSHSQRNKKTMKKKLEICEVENRN